MTSAEKSAWEQLRSRGRNRFIVQFGIVKCGFPLGLFVAINKIAVEIVFRKRLPPIWEVALVSALLAVAVGGVIGAIIWRKREGDYQKPTESDHT